MTPRELLMAYKAFRKRKNAEERHAQLLAYNTAVCVVSMLGAALGGKQLPSFSDIFGGETTAEPMTLEQMRDRVIELNRQFGGKVIYANGGDADGGS